MKLIMQIIIGILTAIAHLPLIDMCVLGIKLAIPTQDYLAVGILVIEALMLVALMVGMIYVDIKGEDL